MKNISFISFLALIISFTIFGVVSSCINRVETKETSDNSNLSKITIRMSDANAECNSVVLDIKSLELVTNDNINVVYQGGIDNFNNGLINLSDCTNGRDTDILRASVHSGNLKSATLHFGDNCYLETNDGKKRKLILSEQFMNGYTIDLNAELIPNTNYSFLIGFDDVQPIAETDNGEFVINSELICKAEAGKGALQGRFNESKKITKAYLVHSGDTLTAAPKENGYFRIGKVPTGEYDLHVVNKDSGQHHKIKEGVRVNSNTIKDVGSLHI